MHVNQTQFLDIHPIARTMQRLRYIFMYVIIILQISQYFRIVLSMQCLYFYNNFLSLFNL